MASLRQKAGCWICERWRMEVACGPRWFSRMLGIEWPDLCNRNERVLRTLNGGRVCQWQDSSMLTLARVFPSAAARLMQRALEDWPLPPSGGCLSGDRCTGKPKLCVILPVSGAERAVQLRAVLRAMLSQKAGAGVEIIVVEHGPAPSCRALCLPGVRHIHIPVSQGKQFNKSLAFNEGARATTAPWLLLHDADVVPPADYASEILRHAEEGWDAARLLRFLFLLDEPGSALFINSRGARLPDRLEGVHQNYPGVSTAISCKAYWRIGGHDERFEGWGGEDLEFLDRLETVRQFPGAFLPALHLWHPPATQKRSDHRNREQTAAIRAIPPEQRIRDLVARNGGGAISNLGGGFT